MKIVRDNIPEIMKENSKNATFTIAKKDQIQDLLRAKLHEELNEYLLEGNVEELVDIIEVIYALAKCHGYTEEEVAKIRNQRIEERGKYEKGIVLEKTEN